jgi:hypothetical protein
VASSVRTSAALSIKPFAPPFLPPELLADDLPAPGFLAADALGAALEEDAVFLGAADFVSAAFLLLAFVLLELFDVAIYFLLYLNFQVSRFCLLENLI